MCIRDRCSSRDLARCSGKPTIVKLDGVYDFYVGFTGRALSHSVFVDHLLGLEDCFTYMDQRVCTSILEFEYVDPRSKALETARRVLREGKLKIVFGSPTMLRDPFRRGRY